MNMQSNWECLEKNLEKFSPTSSPPTSASSPKLWPFPPTDLLFPPPLVPVRGPGRGKPRPVRGGDWFHSIPPPMWCMNSHVVRECTAALSPGRRMGRWVVAAWRARRRRRRRRRRAGSREAVRPDCRRAQATRRAEAASSASTPAAATRSTARTQRWYFADAAY